MGWVECVRLVVGACGSSWSVWGWMECVGGERGGGDSWGCHVEIEVCV